MRGQPSSYQDNHVTAPGGVPVRTIWGFVRFDGVTIAGSGDWTALHVGTGLYEIIPNQLAQSSVVALATQAAGAATLCIIRTAPLHDSATMPKPGLGINVDIRTGAGVSSDQNFTFLAYLY